MHVVCGRNIEEWEGARSREIVAGYPCVLVDIGAGTGRFAYEIAARRPDFLCIGLDAEARNLAGQSARARRKPARGGVPNVLFVLAPAEELPPELGGSATHVCVNLPWGSLLQGLVLADARVLGELARIARPGAVLEMLLSYSPRCEPRMMEQLGLPELSAEFVQDRMTPAYAAAGISIAGCDILGNEAVRALPLDWGRSLAWGRSRDFYYVTARFAGKSDAGWTPVLRSARASDEPAAEPVLVTAYGHPNLLAKHPISIEITRDADLSDRGDCIVGVRAEFDPQEIARLLDFRRLRVTLRAGDVEDGFTCGVNGEFGSETELVFRKSAFRSERTLGTHASKSASQLSRRLVERLRDPAQRLEVVLSPSKPIRKARPGP